jgi:prepilin-type N-terminal cleavage/methylation domain-containing protein
MVTKKQTGFTIVELLIVIVIIGILAAITIVAYNGIQERARQQKIQTDLTAIEKAIVATRISESNVIGAITSSYGTGGSCAGAGAGTDLAALAKTHACWTRYAQTLDILSNKSGMNIRDLVDPWGRPYVIDENEHEGGSTNCTDDYIGAYAIPLNGWARMSGTNRNIPNYAQNCL